MKLVEVAIVTPPTRSPDDNRASLRRKRVVPPTRLFESLARPSAEHVVHTYVREKDRSLSVGSAETTVVDEGESKTSHHVPALQKPRRGILDPPDLRSEVFYYLQCSPDQRIGEFEIPRSFRFRSSDAVFGTRGACPDRIEGHWLELSEVEGQDIATEVWL